MQASWTGGPRKSQPLTDRHTIADLWSDLYQTWTRNSSPPGSSGDPSERKAAELSAPALFNLPPKSIGYLVTT